MPCLLAGWRSDLGRHHLWCCRAVTFTAVKVPAAGTRGPETLCVHILVGPASLQQHQHTCRSDLGHVEVTKRHQTLAACKGLCRKCWQRFLTVHTFKSSTLHTSVLGSQSPCCKISLEPPQKICHPPVRMHACMFTSDSPPFHRILAVLSCSELKNAMQVCFPCLEASSALQCAVSTALDSSLPYPAARHLCSSRCMASHCTPNTRNSRCSRHCCCCCF